MLAWPMISCSILGGYPAWIMSDAAVCRRSWTRNRALMPAWLQAARKTENGLACAGEAEAVRQGPPVSRRLCRGGAAPEPLALPRRWGCNGVISSPGEAEPYPRTSARDQTQA